MNNQMRVLSKTNNDGKKKDLMAKPPSPPQSNVYFYFLPAPCSSESPEPEGFYRLTPNTLMITPEMLNGYSGGTHIAVEAFCQTENIPKTAGSYVVVLQEVAGFFHLAFVRLRHVCSGSVHIWAQARRSILASDGWLKRSLITERIHVTG